MRFNNHNSRCRCDQGRENLVHATEKSIASRGWIVLACAVTWLSVGATAKMEAQDIRVAPPSDPCYVGEPAIITVEVHGCARGERPTCRLKDAPPQGVTVRGPYEEILSSQSLDVIINHRRSTSGSVSYGFSFAVDADREGNYRIGPFEVTYRGAAEQVDSIVLQFGTLESDPDMQIAFSLPKDAVYIGQDVPVTIQWTFVGEKAFVKYAQANLRIRSPLFDQFPFRGVPEAQEWVLIVVAGQHGIAVPATATQEERDGRPCFVLSGTLVFVPDTPGRYESIPITCRTEKVTEVTDDWLSRRRVASKTALARAVGTPLSFEVKPIPLDGRPASYSGAVGSGFSLDVSANRSVVRVGDPISLTLSVRGDGNLESVSLPVLAKDPGLSVDLFQVPTEDVAGTYDGNTKQFKVNVHVKDQRVTQIPPIAFSWFDPVQEQFQTTQSKPIALQVTEAQIVSAAHVVSAAPAAASAAQSGAAPAPSTGGGSDTSAGFALAGANLAIEQDVSRLLTDTALGMSPRTVTIVVYALSAAVLVGGVILRRRSQVDTQMLQKKKRLKALRKQLASVGHLPARDSAELIAKTLRELIAHHAVRHRAEADRVIATCETIIYATGQGDSPRVEELAQQARTLIDDAAEES